MGKVVKSQYSIQAQPRSSFGHLLFNIKKLILSSKKCCAHLETTELSFWKMKARWVRKTIREMKQVLKF